MGSVWEPCGLFGLLLVATPLSPYRFYIRFPSILTLEAWSSDKKRIGSSLRFLWTRIYVLRLIPEMLHGEFDRSRTEITRPFFTVYRNEPA